MNSAANDWTDIKFPPGADGSLDSYSDLFIQNAIDNQARGSLDHSVRLKALVFKDHHIFLKFSALIRFYTNHEKSLIRFNIIYMHLKYSNFHSNLYASHLRDDMSLASETKNLSCKQNVLSFYPYVPQKV